MSIFISIYIVIQPKKCNDSKKCNSARKGKKKWREMATIGRRWQLSAVVAVPPALHLSATLFISKNLIIPKIKPWNSLMKAVTSSYGQIIKMDSSAPWCLLF